MTETDGDVLYEIVAGCCLGARKPIDSNGFHAATFSGVKSLKPCMLSIGKSVSSFVRFTANAKPTVKRIFIGERNNRGFIKLESSV